MKSISHNQEFMELATGGSLRNLEAGALAALIVCVDRWANEQRAAAPVSQPAAQEPVGGNVPVEARVYKVIIVRNGHHLQIGTVRMCGNKGWQYTPFCQQGPSRKYHATAHDAVKGRVKEFTLEAAYA